MRRKVRSALTVVVVMVVALGVVQFDRLTNNQQAGASSFAAYYLDVGASASLGMQPTGLTAHNGHRTDTGYANDLVLIEGYQGMSLTLHQIGCPAETVQSILQNTLSNHCYAEPNTQLTEAVAFLQANQSEAGLVTVDLGFNNIRVCFATQVISKNCVAREIAAVGVDLPKVLAQLRAAAATNVRFVGVEYSDPYLADFLNGAAGPANAAATLVAMDQLNTVLTRDFDAVGASIANVPGVFQMNNSTRVTLPNVGTIPKNVEETCELTWMCYGAPFGPDDHPNEAGYALIAQAIAAELPASW